MFDVRNESGGEWERTGRRQRGRGYFNVVFSGSGRLCTSEDGTAGVVSLRGIGWKRCLCDDAHRKGHSHAQTEPGGLARAMVWASLGLEMNPSHDRTTVTVLDTFCEIAYIQERRWVGVSPKLSVRLPGGVS